VLPVDLDYDSEAVVDEREEEMGPIPAAPHSGPAVDEVEAIFGS
jgi:hypothetical protein